MMNEKQEHDGKHSKKRKRTTQDWPKESHAKRQLGRLSVASIPKSAFASKLRDRILILEELHDSSNLRKALRCAEAFGIGEVLCVLQNTTLRSRALSSSFRARVCLNLSV